jgi:Subunit 11 of the general transcription factor TFIIH
LTENIRHEKGGYSSLKRLAKDYHHLLQTLLNHDPPAKPFMTTQYLIRIVGDLNEQLPSLPPPEDPRGVFHILKQLDEATVTNLSHPAGRMSQTERVRLRAELERARGLVALAFEDYHGVYDVEDAIGRVYEHSLEEMEEPFGVGTAIRFTDEDFDEDRLQESVTDDVDVG